MSERFAYFAVLHVEKKNQHLKRVKTSRKLLAIRNARRDIEK
jgi:hypothetical protein